MVIVEFRALSCLDGALLARVIFCFDGLRYLARGAVMSSAYDATDLVGRWP